MRFIGTLKELIGSAVEVSQVKGNEGDQPNAIIDFANAYPLAAKSIGEEELRVASSTSQSYMASL